MTAPKPNHHGKESGVSPRDWFDDYGDPENRKAVVDRQLARLRTSPPEDPAIVERKRRESAEKLRRQDVIFGTYWGVTLGAKAPWSVPDERAGMAETGGD